MKKMTAMLLGCAGVLLAAGYAEEVKVERGRLGPYEQIFLRGALLEMGFVPEIGGRIMTLKLREHPFNFLRVESEDVLNVRPGTHYPYYWGVNYGGLRGVHNPGWPGLRFNNVKYKTEVRDVKGVPTLVAWAEADGVRDERRIQFVPQTTKCRIETTLTNLRGQYNDMMIRLNGEYAVGPKGAVTLYPLEGGKLQRTEYVMGQEEGGRGMEKSQGDWVAIADVGAAVLMLIRYPSEEVAEFLKWFGGSAREGLTDFAPFPENYFGFIGYNFFQKIREVPPGGTISLWQEHVLYDGFTDLDLIDDLTVFQIKTPKRPVHHAKPIPVEVAAARPEAGAIGAARVIVTGKDNQILAEQSVRLETEQPGKAKWVQLNLSPKGQWPTGAALEIVLEYKGHRAARRLEVY